MDPVDPPADPFPSCEVPATGGAEAAGAASTDDDDASGAATGVRGVAGTARDGEDGEDTAAVAGASATGRPAGASARSTSTAPPMTPRESVSPAATTRAGRLPRNPPVECRGR